MAFQKNWIAFIVACLWVPAAFGQTTPPRFKVIAFYTGKADAAHISFVNEARPWFARMAAEHGFSFESTTNWDNLNPEFLTPYQVVVFLDTPPGLPATARGIPEVHGKRWRLDGLSLRRLRPHTLEVSPELGLVPQGFPGSRHVRRQYLETHIGDPPGGGQPSTLRPSACLSHSRVHPNEWYKWTNDLRTNRNIRILAAIDPTSFPLGTGPKPHEIWHDGYYPVVWTNHKFRMIYFNMGHNDMDYETRPSKELSSTFSSEVQVRLILNALEWLGTGRSHRRRAGRVIRPMESITSRATVPRRAFAVSSDHKLAGGVPNRRAVSLAYSSPSSLGVRLTSGIFCPPTPVRTIRR